MCPKCGAIYNLKFSPPKRPGVCDADGCQGTALIQRADDQEATILQRLMTYHETTEPIIAYYEKQSILKTVSGTGASPGDVFRKVEEILSALGAGPGS